MDLFRFTFKIWTVTFPQIPEMMTAVGAVMIREGLPLKDGVVVPLDPGPGYMIYQESEDLDYGPFLERHPEPTDGYDWTQSVDAAVDEAVKGVNPGAFVLCKWRFEDAEGEAFYDLEWTR